MAEAASGSGIRVRVVYAVADAAWQVCLTLPAGTNVEQAVEASCMAHRVPDYPTDSLTFGIFGRNCGPERILADGDRVEIYRPLRFDPMESRRRRAAHRER